MEQTCGTNRGRSRADDQRIRAGARPGLDPRRAGSGDENRGAEDPAAQGIKGRRVDVAQIRVAIEQLTDRGLAQPDAVSLGEHRDGVTARASDHRYTSTEVLTAEARVLHLAEAGRGRGFGQVRVCDIVSDVALATDQLDAVTALTGSGDFLSVLTAPAGAGKTTTLGAAARTWHAAGYQVIGLAPSARAAAEIGQATGGRAETLAKWLHEQARLDQLPVAERARWTTTSRTVLVVDEASMASTFDLARLATAAARANTKVVLVGDPAQIGVINGPGGLLAALADRGHGVQLGGVHRFHQQWEAAASLRLRVGDPTVIATYAAAGRLHAVEDADHAVAAVFTHWQTERANGHDVLMLARTRADVDQLNALAKAAARASGESHGPELEIGGRRWQAGDLLRTRRNNRRILVGESHVRNGDRYRVLAATPAGLLVDDVAGRGRTLLPAAYLAQHVDYGWASTIDAAQGATSDIAILLARPGIDREHLYVGLTRGRQANHVYVTSSSDDEQEYKQSAAETPTPANQILLNALNHSGRQDAAHTLFERAELASARRHNQSAQPPTAGRWHPERRRGAIAQERDGAGATIRTP